MPVAALKSLGQQYGVPMPKMEEFWDSAKKSCSEKKGDEDAFYKCVMGTAKVMAQNYAKGRASKLKS